MIDIRLSDNLELMAEMQDNTVDLIYCDILYGTGRDFGEYQDLKPNREVIEEHYIPRIKEMHRILKDTGVLVFQLDCKINHWIRCLLDDFFGCDNFRNQIIWKYRIGLKAKSKKFKQNYDTIIVYSKSKKHTFNEQKEKIKPRKKYFQKFENGKATHQKHIPPVIVDEQLVGSVWVDIKMRGKGLLYPTEKPKNLLERVILAFTKKGDLVADFYGGSFTTAEVCKDLNRNFIGCDISEKAVAIGLERTKY